MRLSSLTNLEGNGQGHHRVVRKKGGKYHDLLEVNEVNDEYISPDLCEWINDNAKWPFSELAFNRNFVNFAKDKKLKHIFVLKDSEPILYLPIVITNTKPRRVIVNGMNKILGGQELTDYADFVHHSINSSVLVISGLKAIIKHFKMQGFTNFEFSNFRADSLLIESLQKENLFENVKAVDDIKINDWIISETEVSPYIELSADWELYLSKINKKDRQELKLKLNRLNTKEYKFEADLAITDSLLAEFFRLHKLSAPEKDAFMSTEIQNFFKKLTELAFKNWKLRMATLKIESNLTGCILYFQNGSTILGYNSGFDPAFNYYSPGLMTAALLIKHAQENSLQIFDFLRGSERYKFDLGATAHQLYKLSFTVID